MHRTPGQVPQYWMDTISTAPAPASGTGGHDEDVHRASEEENAYTDTNHENSMDQSIPEMHPYDRQFESDMEDFPDTDTDENDSIMELEDEINRMNEHEEQIIYRWDQLIEDIELADLYEYERARMEEFNEEVWLTDQLQIELASSDESTMEELVDTDTDEDDSTGDLDDDMFRALSHVASSLCLICRGVARGIFRLDETHQSEYVTHHLSLSSLQRSVDDGCRLCMVLAQSLEDFCKRSNPPVAQKEFWTIKVLLRNHSDPLLWLRFWLCQCESDHPYGTICEDASSLHNLAFYPARKLGLGPEFLGVSNDRCYCVSTASANLSAPEYTLRTSSAKSATSLAIARSWYQQCLNHATCRNWRQESKVLPTRLVHIWRADHQLTDLSAKICEAKDLPTSTPYVTLSHCWGKEVIFKLLQNNLQELSQAIPIGRLPKVFQDAFHVSYELGINYIWIDSLCIIQDSKKDWTSESKKMGDVYLNGEFNIAATGYEDGLLGLFGERKAFSFVHIPMHVECELLNEDFKTEALFEGLYVTVSDQEFSRNVVYSPLNNRGWVAQERALSPAVLHYTPEKMYWECNHSIASEAFSNGSHIWEKTEGSGPDRIRSLSTQSEREDVYSFWRTFLNRYAGMDLTIEQDRLPAVAGIARILSELVDDNFVAGFWEGDLLRSLLLERHILVRQCIKPEQLAPSWSWASMNADSTPPFKELSQLEPLKGVRFRVLSDTPGFESDLQSPSFEQSGVRGLAIRGVLRELPDDFDTHKKWIGTTYFTYDNKELAKFLGHNILQEQAWRLSDPTHMLVLARRYDTMAGCVCIHGLLVQPADPNESNTFRRSGTFELAFHIDQDCYEYLGLREKDGEYEPSSYFRDRGLQDLVLI